MSNKCRKNSAVWNTIAHLNHLSMAIEKEIIKVFPVGFLLG